MELKSGQENQIFSGGRKTVYVCHGAYEFLQKETAWKIVEFLLTEEERETGLQKFDGAAENALDAIADAASVKSMFSDSQVILVYNAEKLELKKSEETGGKKKTGGAAAYSNQRAYEKLVEAVSGSPDEGTHMIFVADESIRRPTGKTGKSTSEKVLTRCYRTIEENGIVIEYPLMYDNEMLEWVMKRAADLGIKWRPALAEMFFEWAGKDARHIAVELEKLAVYFGGAEVDEREMRRLVTSGEDFFLNYMVDFTLQRRPKAALRMFRRSLERGAAHQQMLGFITSRLRQLWQARYLLDIGYFPGLPSEYGYKAKQDITYGMSKVKPAHAAALSSGPAESILKKTPFAVFQLLKQARNYTLGEIESAISRSGDVDRRMKGIEKPVRGNDEIMMETLIVDIAAGAM